jgi:glycosyltransferase involved in cell wall biosynthesis
MKIAYVSRRTWPARGGIESFLQRLYRHLSAEHDVSVFAQRTDSGSNRPIIDALRFKPFAPFEDDGVPIRPFSLSRARRLAAAPLVLQASPRLRRRSPHGLAQERMGAAFARIAGPPLARTLAGADIVHVMGGYEIAGAGVAAAARLGVPVVVSPFAHPGWWDDDAASAWAYRRADRVVATMEADAATYRSLGVQDEHLDVIGLFCDTPPDGLDSRRLRSQHGIEGPLVVFLGGRYTHKGVDVLLDAVPLVLREHPDATFAFVGPGPAVEGPRVIDAGPVEDLERWEWLAAANILSLPSDAETFGLVLLEAWATHTAVVTSDIPALAELVGRAAGGAAVARTPEAQARALCELLAAPDRLRAVAASGHRYWFDHGRPESVGARYEALYSALVAGSETALRTPQRSPATP